MLFDSHCHLNFVSFADEYRDILADCLKKDIGVINIGSTFETSKRAVEIAQEYSNKPIYTAIGLHPIHASQTEFDPEEIEALNGETEFKPEKYQSLINVGIGLDLSFPKTVAIGEIGLDYWHIPEGRSLEEIKEQQKKVFKAQLDFAVENNLPVILHSRASKDNDLNAPLDMLEILKDYKDLKGVMHSYDSRSGLELAKKFLDLGFYLGFTGVITFKNKTADPLREVVQATPLDKILVETDAPYLAPEPHRGEKNKPQYVEFVARKVAELKNISYEKVCEQTTENIKNLFNIKS